MTDPDAAHHAPRRHRLNQAPASLADPLLNALPPASQLSLQRHRTLSAAADILRLKQGKASKQQALLSLTDHLQPSLQQQQSNSHSQQQQQPERSDAPEHGQQQNPQQQQNQNQQQNTQPQQSKDPQQGAALAAQNNNDTAPPPPPPTQQQPLSTRQRINDVLQRTFGIRVHAHTAPEQQQTAQQAEEQQQQQSQAPQQQTEQIEQQTEQGAQQAQQQQAQQQQPQQAQQQQPQQAHQQPHAASSDATYVTPQQQPRHMSKAAPLLTSPPLNTTTAITQHPQQAAASLLPHLFPKPAKRISFDHTAELASLSAPLLASFPVSRAHAEQENMPPPPARHRSKRKGANRSLRWEQNSLTAGLTSSCVEGVQRGPIEGEGVQGQVQNYGQLYEGQQLQGYEQDTQGQLQNFEQAAQGQLQGFAEERMQGQQQQMYEAEETQGQLQPLLLPSQQPVHALHLPALPHTYNLFDTQPPHHHRHTHNAFGTQPHHHTHHKKRKHHSRPHQLFSPSQPHTAPLLLSDPPSHSSITPHHTQRTPYTAAPPRWLSHNNSNTSFDTAPFHSSNRTLCIESAEPDQQLPTHTSTSLSLLGNSSTRQSRLFGLQSALPDEECGGFERGMNEDVFQTGSGHAALRQNHMFGGGVGQDNECFFGWQGGSGELLEDALPATEAALPDDALNVLPFDQSLNANVQQRQGKRPKFTF